MQQLSRLKLRQEGRLRIVFAPHEPTPAALVGAVLGGIGTLVAHHATTARPAAER